MKPLPLLLLLTAPQCADAHGHLLRAVVRPSKGGGADKVACAANANAQECANPSTRLRKLIPRSGNDGACKTPPGCELGCPGVTGSRPGGAPCANQGICDHCGLEKVAAEKTQVGTDGAKWWTKMPAAHWDEPDQWPIFPCMSRDAFGAQGTVAISTGDSISTTIYMNADHSGLYRYELACGEAATNEAFNAAPITPWKALHASKELAPGAPPLPPSRDVGSTRAETDAYWGKTVCTAAGCPYRMNGAQPQYPAGAFGITSAECKAGPGGPPVPTAAPTCFIEDTFTLPADVSCRGPATLRWMWNSAEGLETYANCLDLQIEGAYSGGGGSGGGGSGGGGVSGGGGGTSPGSGSNALSSSGDGSRWSVVVLGMILIGLVVLFGRALYRHLNPDVKPESGPAAVAEISVAPAGGQSAPQPPPGAPALPAGWKQMTDPTSGVPYYYNTADGESRWQRPTS